MPLIRHHLLLHNSRYWINVRHDRHLSVPAIVDNLQACSECPHSKMNALFLLADVKPEIAVNETVQSVAKLALDRML